MSFSRKAADFHLFAKGFAKGAKREALQDAMGFLGSLPPARVAEAEDFILNAAWQCLRATEEENEAPTRPAFAEKLENTRKTAHKFSRGLNSIIGYVHPIALRHRLLNVASDKIKDEALLYNFLEIQRRLPFLIDTLTAVEGGLREQGLDKGAGGSPSWYETLIGSAKWQLVLDCHSLFEEYHPGEATPTKFGPFNNFCEEVYGIALDIEPTADGIGIRRYTEEVCRVSKEIALIQARHNKTRRALKDPKLSKKARLALMADQEENIRQLQSINSQYPW